MNWEVFTDYSTIDIQLHWATVTIAFVAGLIQLIFAKGTPRHRFTGYIYVVLMIVTAVSAFFIRTPTVSGMEYLSLKGMSWIHLFIPLTLIVVPLGVRAARQGRMGAHKAHMIGSFLGAILIAGVFTFLPDRRVHDFFFADEERLEQLEKWRGGGDE